MLKETKLTTKLMIGFGCPLIFLAGIVVGTYVFSGSVKDAAVEGKDAATLAKEAATLTKDESVVFAQVAQQMRLDVVQVQQWLTDISATRGLDGLNDGYDEAAASAESFREGVRQFEAMFREENDTASQAKLKAIKDAFEPYYKTGQEMAAAYIAEGPAAGNVMMGEFDTVAADLADRLGPFIDQQVAEMDASMNSLETSMNSMEASMDGIVNSAEKLRLGVLIVGILVVVLSVGLAILISRSITKPIGDVIDGMTQGASQVTSASNQVAESSQQMAQGASDQASSLEETSASLEEMSSMTRQNADNANQANALMAETKSVVERGSSSMSQMSAAIGDIKRASDETAKIVKTIDDVAFQTNLLALNAAVEAARAGDAGKGFAVVAEEVRNLARRSAEAAKNTAELIEQSQEYADNGVKVTADVASALEEISQSAGKVGALIGEIAAASNEQAQGIDQLNGAMTQIDQVTQSNAASSEEAAAAGEELSAQAVELNVMVSTLAVIVGGRSAATKRGRVQGTHRSTVQEAPARRSAAPPIREQDPNGSRRSEPAKALPGGEDGNYKVIQAETVIPLADDDFKDF